MSFPHVVIRASAGTGKTYQLSTRYLKLLHAGVEPERILASTFTRKAAGEILDRVLERLARAATHPQQLDELARALEDPALSRERCLALLELLARNLHRLRVSTLDSFFSQIATSFSLELGLPLGWRIVEPHVDDQLRREAMEAVLASDDSQEVARLLHLMTKGEAERSVSELLKATVNNLYGVYQATDEAAWRNFPKLAPLGGETLEETLEQLAAAELPSSRFERARAGDLAAARQQDWASFIRKGLAAKVLDGTLCYHKKPLPDEVVAIYRRLLRHIEAFYLEQLKHQTGATYELLARFDEAYQQRKRAARVLGFDDVTRALALSPELTGLARVPFRLDGDIAHLLLDEFQDTSYWQWRVLRPFAERVTRKRPANAETAPSFFCVGDIKQAIYGWRGGRSEIFAAIDSQLGGLQQQSLSESRRSSPAVIETVNQVFTCLGQHPGLEKEATAVREWAEQFLLHTTVHRDKPGYVCMTTAPRDAEDQNATTCRHVAERVAELVQTCPGREIGVLTRTNSTVARIIFELKQLGIEASEEGGNPLTDSAAVSTVLSLLRLADHPGDTVARFHVATSPLGRALSFTRWRDDQAAELLASAVRKRLIAQGYGPALRQWARTIEPSGNRRDRSRLRQLVQLAYEYQGSATLRATDFVRFVEMQKVADPLSAAVRVMTVHQSKGLEFDIVVATEFEDSLVGQPPSYVINQPDISQPIDRVCLYRNAEIQQLLPEAMQHMFTEAARQEVVESLCVLYVALTRAAHALYIVLNPAHANERKLPRTVAGCLRASLASGQPAAPGTCLYECGDPDWHQVEPLAPRTESVARGPREAIRFVRPRAGSGALRPAAPSLLEGGTRIPLSRVLRLEPVAAFERGSLIHAWFEQITWLDDGPPDREALRRLALRLANSRVNIDSALEQFDAMLAAPEIAGVLRRSAYRTGQAGPKGTTWDAIEVHNERRFAVRMGKELMSGATDRLVLLKANGRVVGADILDFKTDGLGSGKSPDVRKAVAFYRPQQEAYRSAVARLYDLEPEAVTARLVFVVPRVVASL